MTIINIVMIPIPSSCIIYIYEGTNLHSKNAIICIPPITHKFLLTQSYLDLVLLSEVLEGPNSLDSDSLRLRSLQVLLYKRESLDVTHVADSFQAEDLVILVAGRVEARLNILQNKI